MRYTEVLTKKADVTDTDRRNAAKSDIFQNAFNNAYAPGGILHNYATRVSPGEIMRIALGATAGGGLGWLASRLFHRKPKSLRTLLYMLGGATAGGLGTHWYMNKPDKDGNTIADKARRDAAMADPSTQKLLTAVAEAKNNTPSQPNLDDSQVARIFDTIGWNYDTRGNTEGGVGAGIGYVGGGYGTQAFINWRQNRKIKALNTAINQANDLDLSGAVPITNRQAQQFIQANGATKRRGNQTVLFNADAPIGRRFTLNPDALADLNAPLITPKGRTKRFSIAGGIATAPVGFAVGQWIDNRRRTQETNRINASMDEAVQRFLKGRQK